MWAAAELVELASAAGTTARLVAAERHVRWLVKFATFDVDEHDEPSSPAVREALADAIAEQYAWFGETGDEAGVLSTFGSASIGSVSLSAPSSSEASAASASSRTSPAAREVLDTAGLLHVRVGRA